MSRKKGVLHSSNDYTNKTTINLFLCLNFVCKKRTNLNYFGVIQSFQ
jgi:hypothetical protein